MSVALKQTKLVALTSLKAWLAKLTAMSIAIWLSVVVHATILTIKFEPELKKIANQLPSLNVVLVNAKTKEAPEKADALAQANLDRGGNTDKNKQMKTALPAPKQQVTEAKILPKQKTASAASSAKLKAIEAKELKRVAELEKQAKELMTQLNSVKAVETKPTQNASAIEADKGNQKTLQKALKQEDLLAASVEIDRLEAQIAKQQEEYQKRPKRKFIGARTKEDRFAYYIESWRQKVERIGNMNYPQAARTQKIYGQLRVTVAILADGSIESVEINKSSGHKVLDDAAERILRLAAPFAEFPKEIKRDTDILHITRTWTFTQEDAISTE